VTCVRNIPRRFDSGSKRKVKRLHNKFKADGCHDYEDCVSYNLYRFCGRVEWGWVVYNEKVVENRP
jgi:hypothetical protein